MDDGPVPIARRHDLEGQPHLGDGRKRGLGRAARGQVGAEDKGRFDLDRGIAGQRCQRRTAGHDLACGHGGGMTVTARQKRHLPAGRSGRLAEDCGLHGIGGLGIRGRGRQPHGARATAARLQKHPGGGLSVEDGGHAAVSSGDGMAWRGRIAPG